MSGGVSPARSGARGVGLASDPPGPGRAPRTVTRLWSVAKIEQLILSIYEAFNRNDVDGVLEGWNPEGELKPLSANRSYRGHDELRLYLDKEIREFAAADFRVYTVLEQKQLA